MRIYETRDYRDMSRKAANVISAQMILKPDCVLGLATGSTPIGVMSSWWTGIKREIWIFHRSKR